MKKLYEKRAQILDALDKINNDCEERAEKGESAALTDTEAAEYDRLSKELDGLNALIKRKEQARAQKIENGQAEKGEGTDETAADEGESDEQTRAKEREDEEAFRTYLVSQVSERASGESKLSQGANGAIIPKTIANRIIDKLENICDVYQRATKYHFKGTVSFPVIDDSADDVVVGYQDEFAELTSHVNGFKTVDLKGYLFGALSLVSISLINNTDIDVVGIVITRMALGLKRFLEQQCLHGTGDKMSGILSTENVKTASSATAVTADDLISLQGMIIDALQSDCVWYMHPETREAIRKLKDSDGDYLMSRDLSGAFPNLLLGKPIIVSDKMPKIGAGNKAIFYGDPSGLFINIVEDMSVTVLREKYHTMHAIGVDLWAEMDSKIVEPQKLSVLQMKNS